MESRDVKRLTRLCVWSYAKETHCFTHLFPKHKQGRNDYLLLRRFFFELFGALAVFPSVFPVPFD